VSFEKLSPSGIMLLAFGNSGVTDSRLIYTEVLKETQEGPTYFRGRIRLKNGSVVYTDVVQVVTSGKKKIWFYPNPVNRNSTIKYVLQQGIPAYSSLQLFDVFGRLVKSFSSMPNEIIVADLPAGIIIYRLLDGRNETLETGKLIIQ
jgi:hypothetical protein